MMIKKKKCRMVLVGVLALACISIGSMNMILTKADSYDVTKDFYNGTGVETVYYNYGQIETPNGSDVLIYEAINDITESAIQIINSNSIDFIQAGAEELEVATAQYN